LRDRLGPPGESGDAGGLPGVRPQRVSQWRDQVQSGLVNLGWPVRDADPAIAALEEEGTIGAANAEDPQTVDVAVVLRAALRKLSRQRP